MASSVHKTPTEKAAPAKTASASAKGGKSMETEQIQAEKAGAVGPNPTGQRAMNRLANNNGSYEESGSAGELPVNESGTGGGVGFEGRGGMNAKGGVQGGAAPAGGQASFQGTYGQPEASVGALLQNLADSVAKIQADVDTIKAGLGTPPANLTGPGVVGPSADQIKPQRIA